MKTKESKEVIKSEIKQIKVSFQAGVAEYKIRNPKPNNGCCLSAMPIPVLMELADMINNEIAFKSEKLDENRRSNFDTNEKDLQ